VQAARRLAKRAFRAVDRRFLAEGPAAVAEGLAAPGGVAELFVTAPAEQRHRRLVEAARDAGVPVCRVSGEVMGALTQTVTPAGIAAVCPFVDVGLSQLVSGHPRLVAVLAHVRDPGNAGTVLRTADAAGADGVVFTDASVDVYNPKTVRASAGSLFHLPVTVGVPDTSAVTALRDAGMTVLAADGRGVRSLDDPGMASLLTGPVAWLFGNEAWGLPAPLAALADTTVRVPIYGRAESLNLASAAAICLYASAWSQQSAARDGYAHPRG
jgi:TrmH family RNA methyltransferase